MQLANSLQKTKHNWDKRATFSWLYFDFRGKVLEAGSLLSRAGTCKQKESFVMLNFCKN